MELPSNPTPEQLEVLQQYLKNAAKTSSSKGYGKSNYYKNKQEIIGKKLIIFQNSQTKNDYWYMRFYVGGKKYKTISLKTESKSAATEKALEKWRTLANHIEGGGEVFEKTYGQHQENQYKKVTLASRKFR